MAKQQEYALAIHGGAGTILKENLTPSLEQAYRNILTAALVTGEKILQKGGTSLDAIEQSILLMEDSPLFNAGKGSVYTNEGTHELDAAIMDGKTLNAGAVGGAKKIKNPIAAARVVLEQSEHILLIGEGADQFAALSGLKLVENSYFGTEKRRNALLKIQQSENKNQVALDHNDHKYGTVGAVALDKHGNLAAGTSTGGMTNKKFGRIGDSPIIGAGLYADNQTCAVSSTGHGEYFIRLAIAHAISARMECSNCSLKDATEFVIMKKLERIGGKGGVIAIDSFGNISMPFNTKGMYRGWMLANGQPNVMIYKDE